MVLRLDHPMHAVPAQALRIPKMVSVVKSNPEELVRAFRKVAKKLCCDKSEQRFQEALFAIGTREVDVAPAEPFTSD